MFEGCVIYVLEVRPVQGGAVEALRAFAIDVGDGGSGGGTRKSSDRQMCDHLYQLIGSILLLATSVPHPIRNGSGNVKRCLNTAEGEMNSQLL